MPIGILGKLYVNTGSYGSPTWTEATLVSDLQVNAPWDEGDASARLSRVKQVAKTMIALEVSGKIRVDRTNTVYFLFRTAHLSDTPMDLMILDGASTINGVTGYRADFHVLKWDEDQSMGTVLFMDMSIKPALSANPLLSMLVAGGVPVGTSI